MFFLLSSFVFSFTPPSGYEAGLKYTRYKGEVLFDRPTENKVIQTVNFPKFKYTYNSIKITGSFLPQRTGDYKFRIYGKAYVQLKINGKSYPNSLGPGGSCLPKLKTDKTTDTFTLYAGRMYSLEISLRTGCGLYDEFLIFYSSFNGGGWIIPDTFVTAKVDDCIPSYYGEKCEAKCEQDACSGHGTCDDGIHGTGLCICQDGWEGEHCEDKIYVPPLNCDKGANWVTYGDEINFKQIVEIKNVSQIAEPSLHYTYDAIIVTGSIAPPKTGTYQFRLYAKPYGQLQIGGKFYPGSLGPAGSCAGVIKNDVVSDYLFLYSNATYPFTIKYRAGCGLYSKSLILYWKNGPKMNGDIERAPWEYVPADYIYQCHSQECAEGTFGENCQGKCEDCQENAKCDQGRTGTGKCQCYTEFFDVEGKCVPCVNNTQCYNNGKCYKGSCFCEDNYYGDRCENYCTEETCNNHGTCSASGQCICNADYEGATCKHKKEDKDKKECDYGVTYTKYAGEVLFDRPNDGPRVVDNVNKLFNKLLYNSAVFTGSVVVKEEAKYEFQIDAKPYGQLTIGGQTAPKSLGPGGSCLPTFEDKKVIGPILMKANKFYPFTISYRSGCSLYEQFVKLLWRKEGETDFTIVPKENLRACTDRNCSVSYYGDNCQIHCDLQCGDHGVCELYNYGKDKRCACEANYFGSNCQNYCDDQTCHNSGVCNNNGKCECFKGFEGENCTEKPSSQIDGNSMDCPKAITAIWHINENFGTAESRELFTTVDFKVPMATNYKSLTLTGSLSPNSTGLYRFKAQGKPTIQLQITGFDVANPSFASKRCDDGESEAETLPATMVLHKMYPFTIQYKSGCSSYEKFIYLYYQKADDSGSFEDQDWNRIPITMMRSCHSEECAAGFFGVNCTGKCPECLNGVCSDGITGTGKCLCDDWYTGDKCQFHSFSYVIAVFGAIFIVAIIWICWPSKSDEDLDSDENTDDVNTSLKSSLIEGSTVQRSSLETLTSSRTTISTQGSTRMSEGAERLLHSQRSAFDV